MRTGVREMGRHSVLISMVLAIALCCCRGVAPSSSSSGTETVLDSFLVAIDSIGIELGDSAYMFGNATSADFASDGSIVILDDFNSTVDFYTPDGEHLRTANIDGEGPGQFNSPTHIQTLPGGGFAIYGTSDRKLCRFDSEMHLVEEIVFTSGNRLGPYQASSLSDTSFVVRFFEYSSDRDSVSNVIVLLDGEGERVIKSRSAPLDPDYQWQTSTAMAFTAVPDGSILISDRSFNEWQVLRFDQEGNVLDTLSRAYEPERKSDSLLAAETEQARQSWMNAYGTMAGFEYASDEYFPAILSIQCDGMGRIWVQRGCYDRCIFDVLTPEGTPLFTCSFQPPEWQGCFAWNVVITREGYLAAPFNPERYPLVYLLSLVGDERAQPR
jgi:hypothetical protein